MGWARTLLLGDIGNRLDIADTEHDIADLRRALAVDRDRDESQDEAIGRLQKENLQLEVCVAALVKLLEREGVITSTEVGNLVRMIEG